MEYKKDEIANDLYDLIKVCFLSDKQVDNWARLSRKHAEISKQNMKKHFGRKYIEVNGNKIVIGKNKKTTITIN